jgi:FHA domain-containing protein
VMAPPPAAVLPPSPRGAVVSWGDTGSVEGRTLIKPKARPAEAQAPAATPAAYAPTTAPASVPPMAAATPTTPLAPTSHLPQGDEAKALLQAFKEGLGTPTVQIDALTPDVMRLIGQLLHDSAQGTVDLLVARAALKREVRAEVTMIVAQKNNPLKFSPTVEVALNHLLSPPQRGFMPASQAMQDAYDDLRAHQFGFMAGMKAALDGVLKRFDPAQLEGKLTQKSMLQSLLPATRKARMWEVFQELYAQISAEASDDFHELFGKAFLKAYEAHIDELHNERDRHQR